MSGRYAVYRLLGDAGEVLYIGCSNNYRSRLASHLRRPWGHLIRRTSVEFFDTRDAATVHEATAIKTESPLYNVARPGSRGWKAPAGARKVKVLRALQAVGPATQRELERFIGMEDGADPNKWVGTILGRLVKQGDVAVVGERPALGGPHKAARIFALAQAVPS